MFDQSRLLTTADLPENMQADFLRPQPAANAGGLVCAHCGSDDCAHLIRIFSGLDDD